MDGREQADLNQITKTVIGSAFRVHNQLGHGFLEKVYENALLHEIRKAGLFCEQQRHFEILYDGVVVGDYIADLIVEESVIVEVKVARAVDEAHVAQCLNYLAATRLPVGLVLCFAGKVHVKRLVI